MYTPVRGVSPAVEQAARRIALSSAPNSRTLTQRAVPEQVTPRSEKGSLVEQLLHLGNLGGLAGLDLSGEFLRGRVGAMGLFGFGHLDRAAVMPDHHLQEHTVEVRAVRGHEL